MRKRTPEEMERAKVMKTTRTVIRLKHSLKADEEINAILPDTLDEFEDKIARGELTEVTTKLEDVLNGDSASG